MMTAAVMMVSGFMFNDSSYVEILQRKGCYVGEASTTQAEIRRMAAKSDSAPARSGSGYAQLVGVSALRLDSARTISWTETQKICVEDDGDSDTPAGPHCLKWQTSDVEREVRACAVSR